MSQGETSHSRTSDHTFDHSRDTSRGSGQYRPRRASIENTETRYIHIADPESYPQENPADEAVNTTVNDAHVRDTAGISPELIAQITQNVIQQLKTTNVAETVHTPITAIPTLKQPPPQQQQQPIPGSPAVQLGSSPPPRIFIPDSPQKDTETHNTRTERLPNDSPSPTRRFRSSSTAGMVGDVNQKPKAPTRQYTAEEATTLEKIWGKLFDEEGRPAPRLSQFLRGLATHLIEDKEPKQSIVVTPAKMIAFYESTRIPRSRDIYPWNDIFDHGQSSISQMYRNLHIQHHLVQEDDKWDIKPNIPGLTAKGFETWQTLMILAHPDEEFERLRIAALNMPINNPDDKKERFPKEIPRRLFPKRERFDIRDDLIDAMETYANVNIPRNDKTPAPRNEVPQRDSLPTPRAGKSSRRRCSDAASHESFTDGSNTSEMPFLPAGIERERKPYSRVPAESAIADTTPMSATPIERERKPYSAAPGGGKVHEDLPYNTLQGSVSSLPPINSGTPGLHRSTSNASRPINIPPPPPNGPRMDKMSASEYASPLHNPRQIPYLKDSMGSRRRNHSPQSNNMRRSDTDIRGFQSSSYDPPGYMSRDVFPPPPPPHPVSNPYVPSEPRYEDDRRYGRESDLRRENYVRGGSPNRRNAEPVIHDRRGNVADEEYYRRRDNPLPPPPPPRNW